MNNENITETKTRPYFTGDMTLFERFVIILLGVMAFLLPIQDSIPETLIAIAIGLGKLLVAALWLGSSGYVMYYGIRGKWS